MQLLKIQATSYSWAQFPIDSHSAQTYKHKVTNGNWSIDADPKSIDTWPKKRYRHKKRQSKWWQSYGPFLLWIVSDQQEAGWPKSRKWMPRPKRCAAHANHLESSLYTSSSWYLYSSSQLSATWTKTKNFWWGFSRVYLFSILQIHNSF